MKSGDCANYVCGSMECWNFPFVRAAVEEERRTNVSLQIYQMGGEPYVHNIWNSTKIEYKYPE